MHIAAISHENRNLKSIHIAQQIRKKHLIFVNLKGRQGQFYQVQLPQQLLSVTLHNLREVSGEFFVRQQYLISCTTYNRKRPSLTPHQRCSAACHSASL